DGDALEYLAVRGSLVPHRGLRVPLDGTSSGRCYRENRPVLVADASKDGRISRDLADSIGLGSSIHVPVTRGDDVLGVLKLQSAHAGAFTERDLGLARLFAGTATAGLTQVSEAEAKAAVRSGEARYRAVFESIVDYAVVVMDLSGRITDWNAGAERVLGWTADEVRGLPADVFFAPEDRLAGIPGREMRDALAQGRGVDERWHVRKSGERFFASGEMMPLRDGAGAAAGFVKVLRDRTEPRLAEERLRQSDERLQMALTASGDVGLWDWMVDTDLLHGDAHFARLYGLDPDSTAAGITMAQYQEFVVADDVAPLRAAIAETFERGADFHVEYRLSLPGHPLRWVECKGRLVHDAAGKAVRFSGTAVDVTARKATEAALREGERALALERGLLQAIIRDAPVGISIAGATPEVPSSLNAQGEAMLGHGVGEPGDARYRDYGAMHHDGRPYAPEEYPTLRALRAGETVRGEDMHYRNARTGEIRLLEVSSSPVRNALGEIQAAATVLVDVTDRRRVERQLRRLALIVEQSGDFIGIADAEGRVEYVNTAGRAMVGLADEEAARAVLVRDFFFEEDLPYVEAEIVPRIMTGGAWVGDYRFRDFATGKPVPVHYNQFSLRGPDGAFEGYATVSRDIAERKRAEEAQDLLNRELSHRMKNLLAMVQAIAASTLRGATDVADAREVLASRLVALGKAHDILLGGAAERASLWTVIREGVGVQEAAGRRVAFDGPDVEIGGKAALSLALTMHELTTNAVKYGALSVAEGRVSVTAVLDEERLRIAWLESGGPPVRPPSRKGFGSRLIERGLTAQVGAAIRLDYSPDGVTCVIEAALADFQAAV
ncbi:MAG: PAS domain S-box protein, partial [Parafilimonas terrae]|nr:PAS domain S-box protein [Parafilimonas terrae]